MADRDEIKITEAKEKKPSRKQRELQRNLTVAVFFLVILLVVIVIARGCSKKENVTEKKEEKTTTAELVEETEKTTEKTLSIEPLSGDTQEVLVIQGFYQNYLLGESVEGLQSYIDSTDGIDESRLSMHKKYIEQVSDFVCYPMDGVSVDENYKVVAVTYKIKIYNYEELLPAVDVLFLVNGDQGYRVHNLTTADNFDREKIVNDENFKILSETVSQELATELAANPELNQVYQLYLNPQQTAQE